MSRLNNQKLLTIIGGGWYMEKTTKGIPLISRQEISKKSQYKDDKKQLYNANRDWNEWKPQLHWNKLEWVTPRGKIKRKNPIQFLQRNLILIKILECIIGLAIHY